MTRRKIHFPNGEIWEYKILSATGVLIWSPEGEKHVPDVRNIVETSYSVIEDMDDSRAFHILPSDIKRYIDKELRT